MQVSINFITHSLSKGEVNIFCALFLHLTHRCKMGNNLSHSCVTYDKAGLWLQWNHLYDKALYVLKCLQDEAPHHLYIRLLLGSSSH